MKWTLFEQLRQAIAGESSTSVVTRLGDGAQALFDGRQWQGELALDEAQKTAALRMLVADKSGLLPDADGIFVRSYARAPRLIVIGAAHISQFLAPMATLAGFEVIIIDPRRAFATPERFEGVKLMHSWPDEALAELKLDATSAVVTLTHDPKLDDPALIAALQSPVFYVGALGSKRTHAKRVARLTEAGLAERIGRIHAPVGLDLGGRAPKEIAVSILAQVIQVRYKGSTQS
jgi:xanthine dehydrogenase accessory factor